MKKLLITLALGAIIGVGLAVVVAVVWNGARTQQSAVQQTPKPALPAAAPRRTSVAVALALACTCNLSVLAMVGSVALRRRMDSLSPAKARPKK